MPIRALIFDFDGLILDTETADYLSWQEIFQEHGLEFPLEEWAKVVGSYDLHFDPLDYLQARLNRPLEHAALRERRRRRNMDLVLAEGALPGVETYLQTARRLGLGLAVASSSPHEWVDTHLARIGLAHYFDAVLCSEDVARTKPAPDLFLAALRALGVEAEEAIVFEDSPNGARAAQAARIFCVAVPNSVTRQMSLEHASLILPSLAALSLEDLLREVAFSQNGR